ncbi:MAG: N-methyl-L-tryptophan oxidase [Planctomycetes bacterium]|nr:N-methyl-L-tryptophan oxidase [Planctomycetota bacterium]
MATWDAIVVGGGGMGSAAAYHLAKRGARTLVLEQFAIAHDRGASHGESRIIRLAYFEHPDYVPLVREAYALWREVEAESGVSLLTRTGGLELGPPEGALVRGNLESARRHKLEHEVLEADAIRWRFPAFHPADGTIGVYQPDSGILAVERCVRTHADLARRHGATIHEEETVRSITPTGDGVRVETNRGSYLADRAVVTAGPWAGKMLADLGLPLVVARQPVGFFEAKQPDLFALDRFPIFIWETPGHFYYGFPMFGRPLVKIAHHGGGDRTTADTVDRTIRPSDEKLLRDFIEPCLPDAAGPMRDGSVCLYTNTPDQDFVIDLHPRAPQIAIAAGFCGHGFKFAAVVGAILADLALTGRTTRPITRFSANRFPSSGV